MPFATTNNHSGKVESGVISRKGKRKRGKQLKVDAKYSVLFPFDELEEIQQAFDFLDVSNSKSIDFQDLGKAFQCLGIQVKSRELEKLVSILKVDDDTTMDFNEFCFVIDYVKKRHGRLGALRDAFCFLDNKKCGFVSVKDLEKLLTERGAFTSGEVEELIEFADVNDTGLINYEQFIARIGKESREKNIKISNNSSSSSQESIRESAKSEESNSKTSQSVGSNGESNYRDLEVDDSVEKAIAGPLLINSAIIIRHGQKSSTTQ